MSPGFDRELGCCWLGVSLIAWAGLLGALAARAPDEATARGAFRILVDAREVGREEFEIERSAEEIRVRARLRLTASGKEVEETATLTLSPNYQPRGYEWRRTRPAGTFVRVRFEGSKAALEFPLSATELDRREFTFETNQVAVLDNNFFHHYLFLLRQYDFGRGGVQSVRILIPQELLPAVVTLEEVKGEPANAGQGSQPLRRLRMKSQDNEIWLWVDENAGLMRLTVPQGKVEVLRSSP